MKKNIKKRSNLKKKRLHGFRSRMKTRGGRAVIRNRRKKGKCVLSV